MIVKTKFFGDIEIDNNLIIKFENGIPGFDTLKEYAIIDVEDRNYKCIQSLDSLETCLLVISPWDYFEKYEIDLLDEDVDELDIKDQSEALVFSILTAREGKITTNLVAPIVINIRTRKAKQIILTNSKYSIREEIKCLY